MWRRLKFIPTCLFSSFSILSASLTFDDAPYRVRIVSSLDNSSHVGEIVDVLAVKQTGHFPENQLLKVGDLIRIVSSDVELESIVRCSFIHGIKWPALVRGETEKPNFHYIYFGNLQGQENQRNFSNKIASDK